MMVFTQVPYPIKKSKRKPASAYLAFVVAFALEMFGIPFSLYFIGWLFGYTMPEGILWVHTLQQYIGNWGMYLGIIMMLAGIFIVILGWKEIPQTILEQGKGSRKAGRQGYLCLYPTSPVHRLLPGDPGDDCRMGDDSSAYHVANSLYSLFQVGPEGRKGYGK